MTGGEEMKLDCQSSDIGKIRKLEHENRICKEFMRDYHWISLKLF